MSNLLPQVVFAVGVLLISAAPFAAGGKFYGRMVVSGVIVCVLALLETV